MAQDFDRQRKILDVAAQLFHERGFNGVGIDEIGRKSGISGPAVYRHFKGKDEILATLFDEAMDLVAVRIDEDQFETPEGELDFLVKRHANFVINHRAMVSIFAHEHRFLVDPWRQLFNRRMRDHAASWELTISHCYPEASESDVAIAAQASIGLLHSIVFWPPHAIKAPDLLSRLCHLVLQGLASLDMAQKKTTSM